MINYQDEIAHRKVGNRLYFDLMRFWSMLGVWLVCAVFSFFPLILRPLFTKAATEVDAGYWQMIMGDNDVLYLVVAMSVIALGIAILFGRRGSAIVYVIAVPVVIGIFLAMMGYLMLEGDPTVFGENVCRINTWAVVADILLALALFISVSFRVREGADKL